MNRIVTILAFLLLGMGIASAQNTNKFASTRTTDTAYTIGSLRVDSTLRFVKYRSADSNKVLGVDAGGMIVLRTKGAGGSTDSLQSVVNRGRNTTKAIRWGSGANTQSVTIDSSEMRAIVSSTYYSIFGVSGTSSVQSGVQRSFGPLGFTRLNISTGIYNSLDFANPTVSNKTVTIQDKSGTVALLTDIPDTTRYLLKSDTSALLVTQADLNNHDATNVKLGGQIVGTRMIVGTTDSQDVVNKCFNRNDTIRTSDGLHTYEGKTNEVIARYFNFNGGTGVRNTKGVLIGTSITTEGQNYPYIAFGSSYTTSTPRITETGLFGYSLFNLYGSTTAGTIIKPAFQGTNTGDALTLALGSYTIANNSPTASGIMSMFKVGTGYLSTGRWTPSSGSATLNMLIGAVYVGASGTYTGNVVWATDDSVNLVGLGSGGTYFGYRATKNSGWGFYQTGSSAKNAFVGRSLFGTTTDNGADAVQVVGDLNLTTAGNKLKIATGSNASAGTGTMTSGAVVINTTAVTASSLIFITSTQTSSGHIYLHAQTAGTSFEVRSTSGSDNVTFNWLIIN
jgi:hypothetical protein